MKLPDFGLDQAYAALRQRMGITEVIELRAPDWKDWSGFGIDIGDISEVEVNPDGTLSYRGRRVLVYIRDQWVSKDDQLREYRYHVAECQTLSKMRENNRYDRYVVSTRTDGFLVVNLSRRGESAPFEEGFVREMKVCKNCLTALNWRGYSDLSGAAKQQRWSEFDPGDFLETYGTHVVSLPRHTETTAPVNQYPESWSETSAQVRERHDWTCRRCGVRLAEHGTRKWLHTHHRDGNRANSAMSNLEPLCIGCHQKEFGHEQLQFSPEYTAYMRWRRDNGLGN